MEVDSIYTYEDSTMKPTKHFEGRERKREVGNGTRMEG
jgi:hypothetical protein